MLSYHPTSSAKGDPEDDTVLELLDEYLTAGFLTSGDPLLVTKGGKLDDAASQLRLDVPWGKWDLKPPLIAHSFGFVKGRARTVTLFAYLLILWDEEINLQQVASCLAKPQFCLAN